MKTKTSVLIKGITFDNFIKVKTKLKKEYGLNSLPNTKLLALLLTKLEDSENKIKKLESTIESSNDEIILNLTELNLKISHLNLSSIKSGKLTPPPKSISHIKIDYTKIEFTGNIKNDLGKEICNLLDGNGKLTPTSVSQITNIHSETNLESLEDYQKRIEKQICLAKKSVFDNSVPALINSYVLSNSQRFEKVPKL